MKLYLVRHGQSIGNVNKIHQNADTPLSELGMSQAKELAKRFKSIPLDLILTSNFKRAQSTAEIVSNLVSVKLEINELLREIKRPSILEGKPTMDPVAVEVRAQIRANLHDSLWQPRQAASQRCPHDSHPQMLNVEAKVALCPGNLLFLP